MRKYIVNEIDSIIDNIRFHDFHSPPLDDADFDAKPMILLVGQYSTGKTTFIKYLLEQEFPGMRIGPEPTTDCFIVITKVIFQSLSITSVIDYDISSMDAITR